MSSYLGRRLLPFLVFFIGLELFFVAGMMGWNAAVVDWNVWEVCKTLSVAMLTATIAFLYMMIPYVLYLLFLPQEKQNSKLDKIVTISIFSFFVYLNLFGKVSSVIFWDEFSAAFNFIAVDYLVYTTEVVANITQSYPVGWLLLGILLVAIVVVKFGAEFLFTSILAPKFFKRLFNTFLYALILVISYFGVDMSKLELNKNYHNNEIAKEGTYSLFSAFLKNELAYDSFYLTQEKAENLAILQEKLGAKNVKFLNPNENIARQVNAIGKEQKPNLVIVLMESMSSKFMDENRPNGANIITPNLTKLSQEGIYFSKTYATGTRSVRGIEALTLAVPPLPGMSIVRRQNNENLHNIGSILRDKGYDNKWIYGGHGYFDNMNYYFANNGFQVVDRGVWAKEEVTFANAWGAADEDTFNKVITEADKSYAVGKPFFSFLLTISNHRPYTYPDGRIDLPSKIARREGGVKYSDYSIGKFVEDAKQKPWFDNTVFVFIADHTAGAAGDEEINLEGHHIPFIIYAPKMAKAQRIDTPISQVDALPTILGLMNMDYESRFYGQDVLKDNYESRFFVSNYQKIGYVEDDIDVILKPVKKHSVEPADADKDLVAKNLRTAIAFYQQASDWVANLKE